MRHWTYHKWFQEALQQKIWSFHKLISVHLERLNHLDWYEGHLNILPRISCFLERICELETTAIHKALKAYLDDIWKIQCWSAFFCCLFYYPFFHWEHLPSFRWSWDKSRFWILNGILFSKLCFFFRFEYDHKWFKFVKHLFDPIFLNLNKRILTWIVFFCYSVKVSRLLLIKLCVNIFTFLLSLTLCCNDRFH